MTKTRPIVMTLGLEMPKVKCEKMPFTGANSIGTVLSTFGLAGSVSYKPMKIVLI